MNLNKYGALSTLLVPLTLILYFVKNIKASLTYGMITIGIVGIIDTILMCKASNICSFCPYSNLAYKPIVCMLSIIGHFVILYPLIELIIEFNDFSCSNDSFAFLPYVIFDIFDLETFSPDEQGILGRTTQLLDPFANNLPPDL